MKRAQAQIGSIARAKVHARGYDTKGKVIPRCDKVKCRKARAEMIVTGNQHRITCDDCRRALS